ncbi:hypothetical protein Tco_0854724 [Tanacetum coccineum]
MKLTTEMSDIVKLKLMNIKVKDSKALASTGVRLGCCLDMELMLRKCNYPGNAVMKRWCGEYMVNWFNEISILVFGISIRVGSLLCLSSLNKMSVVLRWGSKSLKVDVGLPSRLVYHDLYLGGKALVEKEIVDFDLTKSYLCLSYVEGHTAKGVGLCVTDSHTDNHREDDFTPLETIRRFLGVIGSRSLSSSKWRPSSRRGGLALPKFFCDVIQYFHVHLSRLGLFGCAKPTTFVVMCKAYGCEPSVELFRGFFNLFPSGQWLTFAKRPEKHIPNLQPKVITRIKEDEDLSFLPNEPSSNFGTGSPLVSINNEPPLVIAEHVDVANSEQLVENIADLGGSPAHQENLVIHAGRVAARIKDRKCRMRGSSKPPVKRRLVQGGSSSRATRQKTSPSKAD